ncbi:MAG: TonB-dependent receptor [Prolixibacteraceae bacterium]|nr:MAG: TonB-dependent receptor [Prolixibacteraceae bacterium]
MKYYIPFIMFFLSFTTTYGQGRFTLSGYISDFQTTEKLPGASVKIEKQNKGVSANNYGFYSLTLTPGDYTFGYSFVGYEMQYVSVKLSCDTIINISLKSVLTIEEVTVEARKLNAGFTESTETGTDMVKIETVKKMPAIGGEPDVLKTLQYLPGIKQSQEGTSAISVRGGSPDQNLILLDGVPVYNVNHLFGFLSVFNSDALSQVKMYKGGIPARYGGKLSSVLDIAMKEGNINEAGGSVSVSPVAGSVVFEGPIKADTSSYLVSARRTFLDLPVRLGLLITQPVQAGYNFYDLTAKANWIIDPKNRIYLSAYLGQDRYFIKYKDDDAKSDYAYKWGNATTVFRWNNIISNKLFANYTGYFSSFSNKQNNKIKDENSFTYKISSGLKDFAVAADFDFYPNVNHSVKFGVKASAQSFSPQYIVYEENDVDTTFGKGIQYNAFIASAYAEDDLVITRRLGANIGARIDNYSSGGKNYFYFQPRLTARYLLAKSLAVKASYSKMAQFLHLITNSSVGLPTDLWVSSTETVKPQNSWMSSLGFFYQPLHGYEFSVDGYLKKMDNIIRLEEGASFLASRQQTWEDNVISGKGEAYGVEFLLKKDVGKLTGWVGYALSKSVNQFDEINNGKPFPYRYDKRHDISVLGEYKLSDDGIDSRSFTWAFTYNTGYAGSIPDIKHQGMNIITEEGRDAWLGMFDSFKQRITYQTPNNYRMPAFHHLDIGYQTTRKLSKFRSRTWLFSVYNVYNRLNPWYFYMKEDKMMQVSLFPIIPSVSFTYKW